FFHFSILLELIIICDHNVTLKQLTKNIQKDGKLSCKYCANWLKRDPSKGLNTCSDCPNSSEA
ncbi:MAG: hypothetical protein P8L39_18005, partial [Halioglobus sp.]|nr:hypothetical protein [Halioglobus sp.]